jgi:hypothetical protein
MTNFSDLEFHDVFTQEPSMQGIGARHVFENGYGVVRHGGSYGGPNGFYEVAVLAWDGSLCYDTPVTNDVLGWLSEDGVADIMQKVEALPPAPSTKGFKSIKK